MKSQIKEVSDAIKGLAGKFFGERPGMEAKTQKILPSCDIKYNDISDMFADIQKLQSTSKFMCFQNVECYEENGNRGVYLELYTDKATLRLHTRDYRAWSLEKELLERFIYKGKRFDFRYR